MASDHYGFTLSANSRQESFWLSSSLLKLDIFSLLFPQSPNVHSYTKERKQLKKVAPFSCPIILYWPIIFDIESMLKGEWWVSIGCVFWITCIYPVCPSPISCLSLMGSKAIFLDN